MELPNNGKVFLGILENFVRESTADTLQTLCKKEHSFAGYWFESMFYQHYNKSPSPLFVECETSPGKLTTKELCLESEISLNSPPSQLCIPAIYMNLGVTTQLLTVWVDYKTQKRIIGLYLFKSQYKPMKIIKTCVTCFKSPHPNSMYHKN